jgi:myo-inositol-1(or 4)-monophosphatase
MAMRLSPVMTVMQNAAQKAARRLLRDFNEVEQLQVSIKGPGDFVTQADMRAETTIREELSRARPGYAFLMEESGASGSENWSWRWVVDPLDGTTNFLHGIPHWAISIGLQKRLPNGGAEIAAALVYNPAGNEMFWAEKGVGAYLNERRLRVSARRDMLDCLFATGIPFAATSNQRKLPFARTLGAMMPQVAGIRRFGSAALDLCWTLGARAQTLGLRRRHPGGARGGRLRHRSAQCRVAGDGGGMPRDRRQRPHAPASARAGAGRHLAEPARCGSHWRSGWRPSWLSEQRLSRG